MTGLAGKRVLLIIGGGIATHKALEAARELGRQGVSVRSIVTRAGLNFVTELAVAHLTGDKVFTELFDVGDEVEIGHIELSRSADIILVAPATADLIAKMANGLADDLATTTLLATDKPVLIAPAMNVRMWHHAATQRNLARLAADGIAIVGPGEGEMACGEWGLGRLAEPAEIVAAVARVLAAPVSDGPLAGLAALVTAGPTHEPIDPVRYIANRSSGRQGYAIAAALAAAGARTTLVTGPTQLGAPEGVAVVAVETAEEMLSAAEAALPADIAVFAAAVADWRVARRASGKTRKGGGPPDLALTENPDILATLAGGPRRPGLVVGFAAETEQVVENARKKRLAKGADWIVANDVSPGTGVFGGARNRVHLVSAAGVEDWPEMTKDEVARRLVERIAAHVPRRAAAE
jgi:phosphopantothenoylcysteine decarboxylase/phosphopantothenate--cysteine ligase